MSKIINDPVHGFIHIDSPLILSLIDHPYFQRLRNIKQLGLTDFVYPGATHTRFHHALGAYHLTTLAIKSLKQKGVAISDEEEESIQIAILLHDIGHGPFSHTLEFSILKGIRHEQISLRMMEKMNEAFDQKLSLAISIFSNTYHRKCFYQLISSQLDMDRLDYLARDSYYTGVREGRLSVDRILTMLHVVDDELVIEEKGILSIESFLVARKIMYWQVYLHKTVLSAEQMLILLFDRIHELFPINGFVTDNEALSYFFVMYHKNDTLDLNDDILHHFISIDDSDIIGLIKKLSRHNDIILQSIAKKLLERSLYKISLNRSQFDDIRSKVMQSIVYKNIDPNLSDYFIFKKEIQLQTYTQSNSINILRKDGRIAPLDVLSKDSGIHLSDQAVAREFLFYNSFSQNTKMTP